MTPKKVDRLRRKMDNLCAIIEKLLSAKPRPHRSTWEHITKLEELIIDLPDKEGIARLVDRYRDKVVGYWQQLEHGEMPPTPINGLWPPPPPIPLPPFGADDQCFGLRLPGPFPHGSELSRLNADHVRLMEPPPPSAEAIRATLKNAFDRLPSVKSLEEDLQGMKNLLMLVTKARAITMGHWKNVQLLSDIFSLAFAKLPPIQQKLYRQEYNGEKKWLRDLRNFIQDEIDYSSLECLEQQQKKSVADGGDAVAKKQLKCYYCKYPGHQLNRCPVLRNFLCSKCFSFSGHTDIRCRNPMVYIKLEDI